MRLFTIFLSIALLGNAGAQTFEPPASLAGKAYQFSLGGDGYTWTVPQELVFGSTTYDEAASPVAY